MGDIRVKDEWRKVEFGSDPQDPKENQPGQKGRNQERGKAIDMSHHEKNALNALPAPQKYNSAGDSDGGDDNDMFMIFIFIGLFVVVMFCAIGTWGWFHWQHLKKKVGTVVSEDEGEKGGIEL